MEHHDPTIPEYQDLPEDPSANGSAQKPTIELSTDQNSQTYSLPSLYFRYAEHIGKRGFSNGLLRIPRETFEEYIAAYEENKRLGLFINQLEQQAREKEQKIRETEGLLDELHATIIRSKQDSHLQQEEKEKYSSILQQVDRRFKEIEEKFRNSPPGYGWIGTVLFIAAGVIFIITDISIIRTIANTALDMNPKEAVTLALGVAFLAIIIKPLVDRVFEKPYQRGRPLRMHALLIGIGIATVLALGIMGAYRKDAFIAEKREQKLEDEIKTLVEKEARGLPLYPEDILDQKQKELEEVQQAFDSWLVSGIFILSSILFAIAGAICFSIGVPAFRDHTNRVSERILLSFKNNRYRKRLNRAVQNLRQAENSWKIAEKKLPLLPNLAILEAEFNRLIQEVQVARAAQHQSHTEAVLAIYRDGYHRGERYIPSEEELAQFEVQLAEQNGVKARNYQLNRQFSGSNLFNSQYLHEYIRQEIHKENKQKTSKNGKVYNSSSLRR